MIKGKDLLSLILRIRNIMIDDQQLEDYAKADPGSPVTSVRIG